ncbi:GNAT family N-acetyltransferase [Bacillus sp. B15-48]|uniref:GNAT family N-acetyltransferase n=1 Tax=Bacillus sp. B15-48 TaxID=1548601 RepID=UPI00193F2EE8|nr:GNAT family N-acetyltransferase [Bacillus sp. B15-48]MBM4765208.1 GNAT family N-acetyltransferase [Bacillus sp. B15-48]
MKIRDAMIEDLPSMLAIYNEAIRNLTATFDLVDQTIEEREKWFHKFNRKYPLIVAEHNGEIAGYCGLSAYNPKAAYANTVELSIYLSEKHRGYGIGGKLMMEVIKRAKKLGYHTIIAGITEGNDASVKLHEKFGFEIAGRLKEVGYKFGKWQNVLYLQLILNE